MSTLQKNSSTTQNLAQNYSVASSQQEQVDQNQSMTSNALIQLERAMLEQAIEISVATSISKCFSKANELKTKYRKMIPNMKMKSTSQKCTICQDDFELDVIIKKLPCKHIMHRECAKQWLKVNKTCPVCRLDLEQHYKNQYQKTQNDDGKLRQPLRPSSPF